MWLSGYCFRANPRAHGANSNPRFAETILCGKPPRSRGQLSDRFGGRSCAGQTPAFTGPTCYCWFSRLSCWANPRVHGANLVRSGLLVTVVGKPPRSRGQHSWAHCRAAVVRQTPAFTGPTQPDYELVASVAANPRVHGANDKVDLCRFLVPGKPPRSRGQLLGCSRRCLAC